MTTGSFARRLPWVLAAALLPLSAVAPAYAASNVICVGNPSGTCNETAASISAALLVANANAVGDTILVGPGTYTDGPYFLGGDITLRGSGEDATILTLAPSASDTQYVIVDGATVQDLGVKLAAADSSGDIGLSMYGHATALNLRVDGAGTVNAGAMEAIDSVISRAVVEMPLGVDSTGVFAEGGVTLTDSTIRANSGLAHSGQNTTDRVSRVRFTVSSRGISNDSGIVEVDDSLIDLGSSAGTGLAAANFNASTAPKAIKANHVTIVGGGKGSEGAFAYAANANALQVSTIQISNSIVRGPESDLAVMAGNNGSQGGSSTAVITVRYSDWASKTEYLQPHGNVQVVSGPGNVNLDPTFVDAAGGNFRLKTGSPVVDKGDASAGGPATDLDGKGRVNDGNGDGTAVRDMGAYELYDSVAPQTRFTLKPAKTVTTRTVKFKFRSNEPGSTFQCKLDKRAWRSCTSPKTLAVKVGKHVFKVRARDASGNVDTTPATYRFKRVPRPS